MEVVNRRCYCAISTSTNPACNAEKRIKLCKYEQDHRLSKYELRYLSCFSFRRHVNAKDVCVQVIAPVCTLTIVLNTMVCAYVHTYEVLDRSLCTDGWSDLILFYD